MKKRFLAFTLAETLIVIGVIGIVSALTLPNLNSSTGEKEKVAKVKKIYQNLQDAFGRAEAVYGPYDEWIKTTDTTQELKAKRIGERITEFLKVSKNCNTTTGSGCFNSGQYKKISGDNYESADTTDYYKVITADGTSVAIKNNVIVVDIDGPTKGKFTLGHDIFWFGSNSNVGVVPYNNDDFGTLLTEVTTRGTQASGWIIKYDNADYLQFQSVSGSTATCKNGNTVTETNPRCK
ncbi:type II secretion system protein [bacterium]|nr:type II secretion system protein [bacterium]